MPSFITIGGGEPGINTEINNILNFCIENNIHCNINTNATKYSELFKKGAQMGIFTVYLTPDAGSREVYANIKGVDLFNQVWENISKYQGDGIITKFIIEEGNKDDICNMVKMCKECQVKKVMLSFDIGIKEDEYFKYKKPVNDFLTLMKKEEIEVAISYLVPKFFLENKDGEIIR